MPSFSTLETPTASFSPVSRKDDIAPQEWAVREDLAAAYRLAAHYGWDDMIFTHFSARVPGSEHFLINPFGLGFDEITASSLLKIDADGKPAEESPFVANPAGFVIHSALHTGRKDAHCVMHLHTIAGQAVAAQQCGLLPITQTAMQIGDVAYHDFEGIATELDERERLVRDMGDRHVMILRNHGTLTVGGTVSDAFLRMYFLERACASQIAAQAGGTPLVEPPAGTPEKVFATSKAAFEPVGRGLAWPALRRKADRIDPTYAN